MAVIEQGNVASSLGPERVHVTRLTRNQIRAIGTSRTIIPAPGAGKMVVPSFRGIVMELIAGTAFGGIATAENIFVRYLDASNTTYSATFEPTGFLDQTTKQVRVSRSAGNAEFNGTSLANAGVEIICTQGGAAFTGGGTADIDRVEIRAYYYLLDV